MFSNIHHQHGLLYFVHVSFLNTMTFKLVFFGVLVKLEMNILKRLISLLICQIFDTYYLKYRAEKELFYSDMHKLHVTKMYLFLGYLGDFCPCSWK